MVESPQRIWIEADDECPYFYEEDELHEVGQAVIEYTRSDLVAELEAEVERLRNMLNGYGKLDAELAIAERCIEALSRTGAVKVGYANSTAPGNPFVTPATEGQQPVASGVSGVGWIPLTELEGVMTCSLPADETVVEVMLKDGTVCRALYSCNLMEAGDWDFVPVAANGEPEDDADSIASEVVAWRHTLQPARPTERTVTEADLDDVEKLFLAARVEADKAMRKFPQPNYVISKIAEEAGEVVKAAIHCAEGRETSENVVAEIRQAMAMLIRLYIEGDQVHGLPPLKAAMEAGR